MAYDTLRGALSCYLHQDFDLDSGTAAEAIFNAVKDADLDKLLLELQQLGKADDAEIRRVLDDHDVHLWDDVSPGELLITITTLAKLMR